MKSLFFLLLFLSINSLTFSSSIVIFFDESSKSEWKVKINSFEEIVNDNYYYIDKLASGQNRIKIFKKKYFYSEGERLEKYELVYNSFIDIENNSDVKAKFDSYDLTILSVSYEEEYINIVNNKDFESIIEKIDDLPFDNKKIDFIKTISKYKFFNTDQIAILMEKISFDINKLRLATQMFNSTVDFENYYILVELLTFQSNKDKLNEFILKQPSKKNKNKTCKKHCKQKDCNY